MTYSEYPVYIPMGTDHLCAVICIPTGASQELGAVLLTGGNYTRTHRNRMWVRTARALAEQGFPSIRLDYHGVGDSSGTVRFDMETPFDRDATAAADFLREATAVDRLEFVATCFGGRTAIAAAASHRDALGATVFPMPVLLPSSSRALSLRSQLKKWLKGSDWGKRFLQHPTARRLRGVDPVQEQAQDGVVSPRLAKDMTALAGRGHLRFVYGEQSPHLPHLEWCLRQLDDRLSPAQRARITVEIIPGTDLHRFQSLADQDIVVERAVASVVRSSGKIGAAHAS